MTMNAFESECAPPSHAQALKFAMRAQGWASVLAEAARELFRGIPSALVSAFFHRPAQRQAEEEEGHCRCPEIDLEEIKAACRGGRDHWFVGVAVLGGGSLAVLLIGILIGAWLCSGGRRVQHGRRGVLA